MTADAQSPAGFSFSQARSLIRDLNRPRPWNYWTDFLVSIFTGHIAIHLILFLPRLFPNAHWLWPAMVLCYIVTVLAYMRSLMFIHELVHLPKSCRRKNLGMIGKQLTIRG